jgi:hypothetical protein
LSWVVRELEILPDLVAAYGFVNAKLFDYEAELPTESATPAGDQSSSSTRIRYTCMREQPSARAMLAGPLPAA